MTRTTTGKMFSGLLFISLFFTSLFCASPTPRAEHEDAGLAEILAAAALGNPGLKAAFHQWQAALERVPQARALPNPQLTFAYFIREIETRVGPQRGKVGIMQMFPWFGKQKLRGNTAARAADAAKQYYENIKLDLFYRVKESYYEYDYLTRAAVVLTENLRLLEYLEGVLMTRYRTGTLPYASLLKIQVERDRLRDRLSTTRDMLQPQQVRLNMLMNRAPESPLPAPKAPVHHVDTPTPDRDHLIALLKQNNPMLKAVDLAAEGKKSAIQLARKNHYPDFSVGVDYMITGSSPMAGVEESGKDPFAAMVGLQIPLWSKAIRAGVKEADARYQAVLSQRSETQNNLLTRLEMVFFQFRDAGRKIALYRDSLLPSARQALEVTRSSFEAGKANVLDYIDSQRTLLAFELEYQRARTHRAQRLAELQMLVGTDEFMKESDT